MQDIGGVYIRAKNKAPKSGVSSTVSMGRQYCKDICQRFSSGRPTGPAYKTHHLCRNCGSSYGVWFKHEVCPIVKGTPRCPCCKRRVKTKSQKSDAQLGKKIPTVRATVD